jgi:hypothetical protein
MLILNRFRIPAASELHARTQGADAVADLVNKRDGMVPAVMMFPSVAEPVFLKVVDKNVIPRSSGMRNTPL